MNLTDVSFGRQVTDHRRQQPVDHLQRPDHWWRLDRQGGQRHADAHGQQHLWRRHDDQCRHAADRQWRHDGQCPGQHRQQCRAGVQPLRRRHLRRRDLGHRQPDPGGLRPAHAHGRQHLHRRHHGECRPAGGERQPGERRQCAGRRHPRRHRHDRRQCHRQRRDLAGQLDRHAQHHRQLHPERGLDLPGRGRFPKRPHKHHRQRHDQRRHGGLPGRRRRARHDLHHRHGRGRRHGHLLGSHQQPRLRDTVALLRREQRLPHAADFLRRRRRDRQSRSRSAVRWTRSRTRHRATSIPS